MRVWADWWVRDRMTGKVVVAQAPNAAILVFVAATVVRWTPYDRLDDELRLIGSGALMVWALDELLRGVNPLRRLLGAVVLAWQLGGLLAR